MADSRMLVGLVLSLLISSLAISFVTGEGAASLGEVYVYEPIQSNLTDPENLPPMKTVTLAGPLSKWSVTDKGLVSESASSANVVEFVSIWSKEGLYENTYGIDNPDGFPYTIYLRKTNMLHDSLQVRVSNDKVVLQTRAWYGLWSWWQQEFNVNVAGYGGAYTIRTELDEGLRTAAVYINDELVASATEIPGDSILSFGNVAYAGIEVVGKGFTITNYESIAYSTSEESFSVWNFVSSLAGVLGWYTGTGNAIVDLFVNLIIKIQQFAIAIVVITIIRGN